MKGQVLGIDSTGGVITGEDGNRYRFTGAQWRDERAAAQNDKVDFIVDGDVACEIYRLRTATDHRRSNNPLPNGKGLEQLKTYLTRPTLLLAGIIVLAALFLNFMNSPGSEAGFSLVNVRLIYGRAYLAIMQGSRSIDVPDGGRMLADHHLSTLIKVSIALWLIPLGAAILVYFEIRGHRSRILEFLVGFCAVTALLMIPVTTFAFMGVLREFGGQVEWRDNSLTSGFLNLSPVSFGLGAFIIGVAGIGLMLSATNRLKRKPSL